ncbi:MAG: response regulator [Beijerinckiaceae bacterium]
MRNLITLPQIANVECLIVDRIPYARRIVQQYLRQGGIRKISEADDSESARMAIRKMRLELLIADWTVLADFDSALLRNVQNWSRVRGHFSFIVTMAEARQSAVSSAIDGGADAILCKPFSAAVFWKRLDHALTTRRTGEDHPS